MGASFEQAVLPHLDAAYNLARWLSGNEADAEDLVQEACMRALRSFDGYRGGDGRAWLLTIVRNTCYTWLKRKGVHEPMSPLDDEGMDLSSRADDPQVLLNTRATVDMVRGAIEKLPVAFREVIVLHELECLSYRQIGDVAGIPLGTVMSRLARARQQLHDCLAARMSREV